MSRGSLTLKFNRAGVGHEKHSVLADMTDPPLRLRSVEALEPTHSSPQNDVSRYQRCVRDRWGARARGHTAPVEPPVAMTILIGAGAAGRNSSAVVFDQLPAVLLVTTNALYSLDHLASD